MRHARNAGIARYVARHRAGVESVIAAHTHSPVNRVNVAYVHLRHLHLPLTALFTGAFIGALLVGTGGGATVLGFFVIVGTLCAAILARHRYRRFLAQTSDGRVWMLGATGIYTDRPTNLVDCWAASDIDIFEGFARLRIMEVDDRWWWVPAGDLADDVPEPA